MMHDLEEEINSFKDLWKGGFRTGYRLKRNQKEIEDFLINEILHKDMTVLEIGCGGGQWSKAICNKVKFLYTVDLLSSEHNQFWQYVSDQGKNIIGNISYNQVQDFTLNCIPANSIDLVFSYDVFCHISYDGTAEYLNNLRGKLRSGGKLIIMYADVEKYFSSEPEQIPFHRNINGIDDLEQIKKLYYEDYNGQSSPGRWYWVGIERFIRLSESLGYTVLDKDLNIDKTNPLSYLEYLK